MEDEQYNQTATDEQTPTDYNLDEPFVTEQEYSGVTVELEVTEVSIPAGYSGGTVFTADPVTVADEVMFLDVARAKEYTIHTNGDLVIDGGKTTSVRYLVGSLMEEVGTVRRVKEELVDSGADPDELDELAQESEDAVVQLYRNTDIKNAELMAKSLSFNGVDEDISGADVPNSAEVRNWVDNTRQQLEAALDALEDIDTLARQTIGDAYENPTTEDQQSEQDSPDNGRTTDVGEIRKMIYDSEYLDAESFVEREEELPSGETLVINSGSFVNELIIRDEDGAEQTLFTSDSPAETLAEFNREINTRQ